MKGSLVPPCRIHPSFYPFFPSEKAAEADCTAMAKIKAGNLHSKEEELEEELKVELSQRHVAKVTGSMASKLSKIRVVHKPITHVLTVINQTWKENLEKFYKGKKYKPLDPRPKKTRC